MQTGHSIAYFILSRVLIFGLISTVPSFQAHAQITFTSERDGNKEIYVMDSDGRNIRNLTKHPADDWTPSWSPDGNRIAFNSNRGGNWEIYVMDADGGNLRNLANDPVYDSGPSWSPDGERIAFTSSRNQNEHDSNIYVMDADGGNIQRLTKDPEVDNWPDSDWSRSAFSVSPASKQLIMWGRLKSESR